ncbi:hypothetical protein [Prosthecochloris sp. HL-130-GSB]|jgi:hypothetical protein|uniref:hypothetical protein n=1 Tax=Prosthecochloris sp. HL-130-GSB TaxID=1974213 RepID=UPI001E53F305|nr:hypothetical protein [Prosthecochloris sp. HL-130-GSB]
MMKVVRIFPEGEPAQEGPAIYSVHYDQESSHELDRLFDAWSDVEYLQAFFEENKDDLCGGYYACMSVDKAVERTLDDAESLEDYLEELTEEASYNPQQALESLFEPLRDTDFRLVRFQESKVKRCGFKRSTWLRLYAIRINSNRYVITGGAIKLTKKMQDREHTRKELDKLQQVKNFLVANDGDEGFEFLQI